MVTSLDRPNASFTTGVHHQIRPFACRREMLAREGGHYHRWSAQSLSIRLPEREERLAEERISRLHPCCREKGGMQPARPPTTRGV